MKVPNRLIAGLGILMISASSLSYADDHGHDGHDSHYQQGHDDHHDDHNDHHDDHGPGRPPQNFDEVRRTIIEHREVIGRGHPLPPNIRIVQGRPLPRGYGRRLDSRSLQQLPRYDGYEWRRMGTDVVLIAVGTGVVYTILNGVLN